MGWNDPSYKKLDDDDYDNKPLPEQLSLDKKDLEMIDGLSKELDFIYTKKGNQILIDFYLLYMIYFPYILIFHLIYFYF